MNIEYITKTIRSTFIKITFFYQFIQNFKYIFTFRFQISDIENQNKGKNRLENINKYIKITI